MSAHDEPPNRLLAKQLAAFCLLAFTLGFLISPDGELLHTQILNRLSVGFLGVTGVAAILNWMDP